MTTLSFSEQQLKDVVKEALLELLQERRDVAVEILAEAMEDLFLTQAIQQEAETEEVSRDEIMQILAKAE